MSDSHSFISESLKAYVDSLEEDFPHLFPKDEQKPTETWQNRRIQLEQKWEAVRNDFPNFRLLHHTPVPQKCTRCGEPAHIR